MVNWEYIKDFPNYMVSDNGQIKSMIRDKILKCQSICGYKSVTLYNDDGKHTRIVHRLVAEHFVPNPEGMRCINHIDEDRSNNNADNLEWCTQKENVIHSTKHRDNRTCSKQVRMCIPDSSMEIIFDSAREAAKELDITERQVCYACNTGKIRGWYTLEYITEELEDKVHIKGYEKYYVTRDGKVYNEKRHRFLKPYTRYDGYLYLQLCRNSKKSAFLIHRLVADAFLPNPEGSNRVSHKNKIRDDNRVENLEWI